METPCIKICKLENDICVGCHRTKDEISGWRTLTDDERSEKIKQLSKQILGEQHTNPDSK